MTAPTTAPRTASPYTMAKFGSWWGFETSDKTNPMTPPPISPPNQSPTSIKTYGVPLRPLSAAIAVIFLLIIHKSRISSMVVLLQRPECSACFLERPSGHADLRAILGDAAAVTVRLERRAHLPPVEDHAVAEHRPVLFGNQLHKIMLDFHGVLVLRQPHAPRQPADMRIDGDAGHAIRVAEDHVRRLAADARQWHQSLHGCRDLAAVFFDNQPAARLDVLGLVAKEAGRLDGFLQLADVSISERLGIRIACEQCRRDHVDAHVSALG